MELRQGGIGNIRAASIAGCGAPFPADGFEGQHRCPRRFASIPQLEEVGGAAQVGGDLLSGNRNEGSASPHLLPGPAAAMLQLEHPADQDEAEAGQDGKAAPCEDPPGEVSSAARSKRGAASDLPGSNSAAVAKGERSRQGQPARGQRPRQQRSPGEGGELPGGSGEVLQEPMSRLSALAARPMLRLSLANPHQLCYANSTVLSFLWMGLVQMTCPGTDPSMYFGMLTPQCLQLLKHESAGLLQYPSWRTLLMEWRPVLNEQQDAAEFLAFVLARARSSAYPRQMAEQIYGSEFELCWRPRTLFATTCI